MLIIVIFTGETCEKAKCPDAENKKPCGGSSRAVIKSGPDGRCVCKCKNGWAGEGCETPLCPYSEKYTGEKKICSGNGVVIMSKDGKSCHCKCKHDWKPPNCEVTPCPTGKNKKICSGNGQIVDTKGRCSCKCKDGWKGEKCFWNLVVSITDQLLNNQLSMPG